MIPKVIHHSAPADRSTWHPVWDACLPSWYHHFPKPEYRHIMWADKSIDLFIKDNFPQYFKRYSSLKYHIMQLDFFRFGLLYVHGGIYVDMDYLCRKNFYKVFNKKVVFVGSPCHDELYQNSLMAAEPGQDIFIELMEIILRRVEETRHKPSDKENYVLSTSGPRIFFQLDETSHNDIQLLDVPSFNPGITDFESNEYNCIHLLSGMWGRDDLEEAYDQSVRHQMEYKQFGVKAYQDWRKIMVENIHI